MYGCTWELVIIKTLLPHKKIISIYFFCIVGKHYPNRKADGLKMMEKAGNGGLKEVTVLLRSKPNAAKRVSERVSVRVSRTRSEHLLERYKSEIRTPSIPFPECVRNVSRHAFWNASGTRLERVL